MFTPSMQILAEKTVNETVKAEYSKEKDAQYNAIDNIGQTSNNWGAPLVKKKMPSKYDKEIVIIQEMGFDYKDL